MDRFKERNPSGMNIARSRQTQTAYNRRSEISQDVAKKIVTYDNVVLGRIQDHEHSHRINILMICFDLGIAGGHLLENSLPQIAAKPLDVRFISHRHALAAIGPRVLESGHDNSFYATPSIQFFLCRYFFRSSLFQESSCAAVGSLSVLAEDHKIDIVNLAVTQRGQPRIEQTRRPKIDVKIQTAPHSEQHVFGNFVRRNTRIAKSAGQNRIEVA